MESKNNKSSRRTGDPTKNIKSRVLTALLLGAGMSSSNAQQNIQLDLSLNQTLNKTNSSAFIRDFYRDEAALFIPKARTGPNQHKPVPTAIFHGIM